MILTENWFIAENVTIPFELEGEKKANQLLLGWH